MINIRQANVLDDMQTYPDCYFNTIYSDPPYQLGSSWIIDENGKPQLKKASDFMGKWDAMGGEQWDTFFKEAYRILKYGGYCLLFAIDRQSWVLPYYATKNGFEVCQSLFWYTMCLSDDTEILTIKGWKTIDTIRDSDIIIEVDITTQNILFGKVKNIYKYDYAGEMIHIVSGKTDQLITPNHKCIVETKGHLAFKYAYQFNGEESNVCYYTKLSLLWQCFCAFFNKQNAKLLLKKLLFYFIKRKGIKETHKKLHYLWKIVCHNKLTQKTKTMLISKLHLKAPERNQEGKPKKANTIHTSNMFGLRENIYEMAKRHKTKSLRLLFKTMFCKITEQNRKDKSSTYQSKYRKEEDRERDTSIKRENDRGKQPSMERRSNIFSQAWKLFTNKICAMPEGIFKHGTQRWLCYGASVNSSKSNRETISKDRSCPPYRQKSTKQQNRKSHAFQKQSTTQKIRSWMSYKTTLAIPVLTQYNGRVWCIETSTGSFIARRNKKIFITGNSGFPKAVDAGKQIDKKLGLKREIIGKTDTTYPKSDNTISANSYGISGGKLANNTTAERVTLDVTTPASDLAKTFKGYKYGTAPFKPCMESILCFRKPCKNESVLNDLMAFQEDDEISPSVVNIDEGRVPLKGNDSITIRIQRTNTPKFKEVYRSYSVPVGSTSGGHPDGRFPTQLFVDEKCAEVLDRQSGTRTSGKMYNYHKRHTNGNPNGIYGKFDMSYPLPETYGDSGGCSRILHTCQYDSEEVELIKYCPKASTEERKAGLNSTQENFHPTVKPISLIRHIFSLFKLPDICNQKIYVPFAGVFSEVIGIHLTGIPLENITACEMDPNYIEVGKARLKYWSQKGNLESEAPYELDLFRDFANNKL